MTKATKRTQTPEEQLQAAIERAKAQHLSVVAIGKRLSDGATCYFVPSISRAAEGMNHIVVQLDNQLVCTCLGGQHGKMCMHQGCVHAYLAEQAADNTAAAPSVSAS